MSTWTERGVRARRKCATWHARGHGIRKIYEEGPPGDAEARGQWDTVRDAAARKAAGTPAATAARDGWSDFDLTQAPSAPQRQDGEATKSSRQGFADEPTPSSGGDLEKEEVLGCFAHATVAPATAAAGKYLLASDPEVPGQHQGYGPEGSSFQSTEHGDVHWTDREVMKKTILCGEHAVFCSDVCDSIGKNLPREAGERRGKTVSLKQIHLESGYESMLARVPCGRR